MQTYIVGGAVRDELLGRPVVDHDYVVVGATPQQMLDNGYIPVGKDFPVFLHPETKEEYALARTERKVDKGYHGFEFYADSDVTLEQDLIRRDLTINAIAKSESGEIIDPYQGQADLKARILRHVSPAFAEDPVRILRVARFAARYANDGFTVAEETLQLMKDMVSNGEVNALVAERVWQEVDKALGEAKPSVFFEVLRACGALARLLPEVDCLWGVPQPEKWHPEIDTGVHVMMVLDASAKLSNDKAVRFAALVHDLGKGITPKEEWPRHIGHEASGLPLVKNVCGRLKVPNRYKTLALLVTEYHLLVHQAFELKAATLAKLFKNTDGYRQPARFELFLLACEADARGRTGHEETAMPQVDFLRHCFAAAQQLSVPQLQAEGYEGAALGKAIEAKRVELIKQAQQDFEPNEKSVPAH